MKTTKNTFENFPDWVLQKWQDIADILAETISIPAALIMKTENKIMEVFISSHSENNPYTAGAKEKWHGLYCETVIKTQNKLIVPNATRDKGWDKTPDIKLGMIAYLGFPLNFPDNQPFGTLCILDNKERQFTLLNEKLIRQFKNVIELDLALLQSFELKSSQIAVNIVQEIAERKRTEAALRESEEKFRTIIETIPLAVYFSTGTEQICEYLNPKFVELFGYTLEDIPTVEKWWNLAYPDENYRKQVAAEWTKRVLHAFETQSAIEPMEVVVSTKDGFKKNIQWGYITLGKKNYSYGLDLTERKRADESLIESELRFRNLLQDVKTVSVQGYAPDGTTTYWNKASELLYGYTSQEAIGKNLLDLIIPSEMRDDVTGAITWMAETGQPIPSSELVLQRKDGSSVSVYSHHTIVQVPGLPQELFCIDIDLTDRKLAEDKLKVSEQHYRNLFDQANEGLILLTMDGKIAELNQSFAQMHGYTVDEMKDMDIKDLDVLGENAFDGRDAVMQRIYNGEVVRFEVEHYHKNGHSFFMSDTVSLITIAGQQYFLAFHQDITERKLSEAIFKDIIEKNPISIQILNMDGYAIQTNSAHTKLFGVQPPDDYSIFKDTQLLKQGLGVLFEQIKKGEVVFFPDSYYNVRDVNPSFPDSPVWIKAIGFTLNKNDGQPDRIVLMHENITERKNAEALLNDIIDKNPMSIQIVDKSGLTLHGNPAYLQLFGSLPPKNFSIFTDLESKSPELIKLISHAKNGEIVHLPDIYFNAHDAVSEAPDIPLWIRALIFPLKDSGGKSERFVFMHENITDRKKAEQELIAAKEKAEESEKKYRQIFDNTFDIMSIYEVTEDRRYKVITFNAAEEKLIGNVENYQNRYIDDCIPPELYNQFKQNYDRCITAEKLIEYEEDISFQNIHKTFYTQLIPLKNSEGRIHRIIVISRDVTDIKLLNTQLTNQNEKLNVLNTDLTKAKEKAEESDRLKSAFLANMSHEIRTPMNGILGFSSLLKEPGLAGEEQQEYIKIIEKSGERMLNIISEIVDISKIESGQVVVHFHEANINEKIKNVYELLKPDAEDKRINLSFKNSLPEEEAITITDSDKLYSILTNLVKNAIKYTDNGSIEFGYVVVDIKHHLFLQFFVKDTGIGIQKDRQEAIFERFIQAEIADVQARQGAGLGLSIAKAYVEMLGGEIWVESEEGIGATFYFTLPYTVEPEEKNVVENYLLSDRTEFLISNLKVLIAEDDETSEKLILIYITEFSNEVIKARTGIEAVEICRTNPDIDLILMDIQMPGLNGYEATRQIRQFNKDVVIIAQTAFGLSGNREKAMAAGCNDYIAKPINKGELLALIQKYFRK
jgi:PAS domain S-box-containing protein